MRIAHLAQPGILEPIPAHGRYLTCQLRVGIDPRVVLKRLASQADGQATVVGIGASLVRELGSQVPGLKTFTGLDGARIKLPATPTDLLVWLRGTDRGDLLIRSRHLETLLAPAFDVTDITDAFNHNQGRDLSGYEDGTENPPGDEALTVALLPGSAGALAGSSFVAVQRWRHNMSRFEAMSRQQQDQELTPVLSSSCTVFPRSGFLTQAQQGDYAWALWRAYAGWQRRGQVFLGSVDFQ